MAVGAVAQGREVTAPAPPAEPLPVRPAPARPRRSNALRTIVVVAVIGAALALLVTNLSESTTYFKTADEAIVQKADLGTRRFRVEGTVVEPVSSSGEAVRFSIVAGGACVAVVHRGDPPELFKPGIPVVLEGRWRGQVYESDRIMIRHSNEYKEKNAQRLQEAGGQGQAAAACAGAAPPV